MKEASFSLRGYKFPIVKLDMSKVKAGQDEFGLNILPEGEFSIKKKSFLLRFVFTAFLNGEEVNPCVEITCEGMFTFKEVVTIDDIPAYFYANSIAILFPYVRAFVSTVTLQANFQPIVLPTMNLSGLSNTLKEHIKVIE